MTPHDPHGYSALGKAIFVLMCVLAGLVLATALTVLALETIR